MAPFSPRIVPQFLEDYIPAVPIAIQCKVIYHELQDSEPFRCVTHATVHDSVQVRAQYAFLQKTQDVGMVF